MHTLTDSTFNSVTIQDPEGSAEEILELLKWNFGKKNTTCIQYKCTGVIVFVEMIVFLLFI